MEEALNSGDLDAAERIAQNIYYRDLYDSELWLIIDHNLEIGHLDTVARAYNRLQVIPTEKIN